jgi:acetyltransferase-like isoleucine patch superfamily enzyme
MFKSIRYKFRSLCIAFLSPLVIEIINRQIRVWGDSKRIKIASTAQMTNTLFNTSSGCITVGDYTFTGHNVSIITGTHQYELLLSERMISIDASGRDIEIGKGVWIGSNALILGPCTIGDHAVIAAGAVLLSGTEVPEGAVFAGVPAKMVKTIAVKDHAIKN